MLAEAATRCLWVRCSSSGAGCGVGDGSSGVQCGARSAAKARTDAGVNRLEDGRPTPSGAETRRRVRERESEGRALRVAGREQWQCTARGTAAADGVEQQLNETRFAATKRLTACASLSLLLLHSSSCASKPGLLSLLLLLLLPRSCVSRRRALPLSLPLPLTVPVRSRAAAGYDDATSDGTALATADPDLADQCVCIIAVMVI